MSQDEDRKLKGLSVRRQVNLIVQLVESLLRQNSHPPESDSEDRAKSWEKNHQSSQTLLAPKAADALAKRWETLVTALASHPDEGLRLPKGIQFEALSPRQLSDLIYPLQRFLGQSGASGLEESHRPDREQRLESPVPLVLVLDHLRSAHNVGSIFRLADGLGVQRLDLIGYTPTPEDPKVAKTAMGTQDWVPWLQRDLLIDHLQDLKENGFQLVALETWPQAVPVGECHPKGPVALVVGNERFGLSPTTLRHMDGVVQVPLYGRKNSLNVVHALAIAAHHFAERLRNLSVPGDSSKNDTGFEPR